MSDSKTGAGRPLAPAVFHILLALAEGQRHGLGIAHDVEEMTEGALRLGPGTLYRSLKLMSEDGLVRPVAVRGQGEDPRRKFYRITERGRTIVEAEALRYDTLVRAARRKKVLPKTARSAS